MKKKITFINTLLLAFWGEYSGWLPKADCPIEFESEDYMDNPSMNPFCEEFYQTENPFMAAFDRNTGKFFGYLEECHQKSFTGYYFSCPLSCVYSSDVLYTDGYTGQIYIADGNNLNYNKEHYSSFEVETNLFPSVHTSGVYAYKYVKTYNRFFDRRIEYVKLTKNEK